MKKDKKRINIDSKTKNNIMVILVVFLIGLFGVLTSYRSIVNEENIVPDNNFVEIPVIQVALTSPENGSDHTVKVGFVLEFDESVKDSETKKRLEAEIAKALEELDYDKVKKSGGVQYIKDEVRGVLTISENDLENIYIVELRRDNDYEVPDQLDERFKTKREEEFFKGLFPNIK